MTLDDAETIEADIRAILNFHNSAKAKKFARSVRDFMTRTGKITDKQRAALATAGAEARMSKSAVAYMEKILRMPYR